MRLVVYIVAIPVRDCIYRKQVLNTIFEGKVKFPTTIDSST
jgi:hypothetical protein